MHQEGDVADTGNDEKEQGAQEDQTSEGSRDDESRCDKVVTLKILREVPPAIPIGLGEVEGIEG